MRTRLPEPCLCGAEDCRRCHPENFSQCSRHGMYEGDECPKCAQEIDAYIADREGY